MQKLSSKMSPADYRSLTSLQQKAIKLWKLTLRDKSAELRSSINDSTRQIDKDHLMMILKPSHDYYLLTIMDIDSNKKNCYEVDIPKSLVDEICDLFDVEMSRRMRNAEYVKRQILDDDIDKLIIQQEMILADKEKNK